MGPGVDSKIKPLNYKIPMLQIEHKGMAVEHRSLAGVMLWIDDGITSILTWNQVSYKSDRM